MKIQFQGMKQVKKSGCSSCGRRRKSAYTFQREKRMTLPSGKVMNFIVGQTYEVMDQDGKFLLNQTYNFNGAPTRPFIEV